MNIEKILDRVRKLLKLSEHSNSEAEAANAAAQAARLMEEYELSEALVRLDDPAVKAEAITEERLEPERVVAHSKRVAWKETIALALGESLGVKTFWNNTYVGGRKRSDMRGFGRETAIQTWRYTCQYLWRMVDEFADQAFETSGEGSPKAWKNAFRVGCASRLAVRILEAKEVEDSARETKKKVAMDTCHSCERTSEEGHGDGCPYIEFLNEDRTALALTVVEKDHNEVESAYKVRSKGFGKIASIGTVSSGDGYRAGRDAGDKISLGGGRAGLASGRGMLTK